MAAICPGGYSVEGLHDSAHTAPARGPNRRLCRHWDVVWWYWLVTAAMLAGALAGSPTGIEPVILLGAAQTVHLRARNGSFRVFGVRLAGTWTLLIIAGHWLPLVSLHWFLLLDTTALLLYGSSMLARLISLRTS